MAETPATRFLQAHGIPFSEHAYDYAAEQGRKGLIAAEELGIAQNLVFKTLMVVVDSKQVVCVALPVAQKMDLAKVAALFGGRNAKMMGPDKAQALTGYKVGGISPFGARTIVPVVFDATLDALETFYIKGGAQGFILGLSPADAIRCTQARTAEICQPHD